MFKMHLQIRHITTHSKDAGRVAYYCTAVKKLGSIEDLCFITKDSHFVLNGVEKPEFLAWPFIIRYSEINPSFFQLKYPRESCSVACMAVLIAFEEKISHILQS